MAQPEEDRPPSRTSAPSPAAPPNHSNHRQPPSRRRRRLVLIVGVVVLLAALAVGGYYYWQSRFYESTDDAYIEGHPVNISARVSGNIVGVYVEDNQHVTQGTPLAGIDPCDYQLRVAAAEAAVQAKRAEVEKASADVEASRAQWTQQQQDLQRNEVLVQQGAVTEQTLQHSQAATDAALANLKSAEKNLASTRAQVAQLEVAVDQARLQLSYTQVLAPQTGYVTQKSAEVGAYVNVGQPLLTIVPDRMYVTANFKETQLTDMRPGQPATIKVDAYPGVVLDGRVDSIQAGTGPVFSLFPPENATGNFVKVVQRVPVKIVFNEPPDPNQRLVLGMSVRPKIRIVD